MGETMKRLLANIKTRAAMRGGDIGTRYHGYGPNDYYSLKDKLVDYFSSKKEKLIIERSKIKDSILQK